MPQWPARRGRRCWPRALAQRSRLLQPCQITHRSESTTASRLDGVLVPLDYRLLAEVLPIPAAARALLSAKRQWAVGAPASRTVGWAVRAACRPVCRGQWRAETCRAPRRSDPRRTQRCMRLRRRRRHRTAARWRSREMRERSPMPNCVWGAAVKSCGSQTLGSSGAYMGSRK